MEAEEKWKREGKGVLEAKLERVTGVPFYNTSRFTFEKLIRRFNEASNEGAGDHFTPRESSA